VPTVWIYSHFMELAGLVVNILSFLVGLIGAVYTRAAYVANQHDRHMGAKRAKGTERDHAGGSRSVWIKAIITTSAFFVFVVSLLLITHPGSSPIKPPATVSPSNGPSSSLQPEGDVPTLPDQAGYNSRWQQSIVIDNTGVLFQQAGPVSAPSPFDADLTYSGGSGWSGVDSDLSLWLSRGVPTPMDCVGKSIGRTGIGTLAVVGDRYCFINNESQNGPIVVSLEVTRIQTDTTTGVTSVTLDAWAWAPQSSSDGQSSSVQPGGDVPTLPDQAGYNSLWKKPIVPIVIDNTGVLFQQAGPVSAPSPFDADLTYSGGSGWSGADSDLSLWLSRGVPTPMDCVGKSSGYTGIGTLAVVGDRYCFINNQSPNGPIVVSLEVTRIQTDSTTGVTSVTLNASAWAPR
jgi:hypothetical protein